MRAQVHSYQKRRQQTKQRCSGVHNKKQFLAHVFCTYYYVTNTLSTAPRCRQLLVRAPPPTLNHYLCKHLGMHPVSVSAITKQKLYNFSRVALHAVTHIQTCMNELPSMHNSKRNIYIFVSKISIAFVVLKTSIVSEGE